MCVRCFATLECELPARRQFVFQTKARMAVFSYIEGGTIPPRQSGIGDLSRIAHETLMFEETETT